jgi:hypothetical protein
VTPVAQYERDLAAVYDAGTPERLTNRLAKWHGGGADASVILWLLLAEVRRLNDRLAAIDEPGFTRVKTGARE